MHVQPINKDQQLQVYRKTNAYIKLASDIFAINIDPVPVYFDLNGRSAGMYRIKANKRYIRYNPFIFAKYFEDNLATTVPHEVAHYVADLLYGHGNIKPHGTEWQQIMLSLGARPDATARYCLSGIPGRYKKRYCYRCECTTHNLSSIRHNRVRLGKADYYCKNCRTALKPC